MKRALLIAVALLALGAPVARGAEWHSEQPVAAGVGVPVPLGEVGDIEFWAPNRGVLITAGNGGMPAGVYAYDGTAWHLYSTVCGGHEGRIAWAGPTNFWTISDQQVGQELTGQGGNRTRISLCHFENGAVVASYGKPIGTASSYLPMDAAACSGPNDCWFAGERLPGNVNTGAFHLHWNGSSLQTIPSLVEVEPEVDDPGRSIGSLAYWEGALYESAIVREGDEAPEESALEPSLLHRIEPASPHPFAPLESGSVSFGGPGSSPSRLEPFHLTVGGGALWAFAGALSSPTTPTLLHLDQSGLAQIPLTDPGGVMGPGVGIQGAAAEPGGNALWVSLGHGGESGAARIVRVDADGAVGAPIVLPGPQEGLSNKKGAGPIACPASEQCWMATASGWLFHLGGSLPQDTEPAMHALITFRPTDESVPLPPPASLPPDDSGSEHEMAEEPFPHVAFPRAPGKRKVAVDVRQRVIHKTILVLSFKLLVTARVQLVAKLHRHLVGSTPRRKLGVGRHRLRLKLDPKRWPDELHFAAHAVSTKGGQA